MKLTDKKWKDFSVMDLFTVFPITGHKYSLPELSMNKSGTPVYSSQIENNGILGYTENKPDYQVSSAYPVFLLFGDHTKAMHIAQEDFSLTDNVKVLAPKQHNLYDVMFIATMWNMDIPNLGYARHWSKAKDAKIKLPVDINGTPDWDWIEQYMKSLEEDLDEQVDDIIEVADGDRSIIKIFANQVEISDFKAWLDDNANMNVDCQLSLDVKEWKPFVTSRLFSVMEQGKANQQILEDGNDCFYVGAKKSNNGVMRTCLRDEKLISKGNCVVFICNGDGSVGYANYFEDDFIGTTDIIIGYNDNLNRYTGLFLATIYSKERFKYSHARKWKPYLMDTVIMLPVKHSKTGKPIIDNNKKYSNDGFIPDWNWIERYMKSLPYSDKEKKKM